MRTRLQRKLEIRRLHVMGELRVAQQRLVEVAMLRWIKDQLDAGLPANAAAMVAVDGLLPRRPLMLAARLLLSGQTLELLELVPGWAMETVTAASLTDLGESALETGLVEVPERQIWEILYAEDPLLPHPVLRLNQAREPAAHDEVTARRRNQKQRRQGAKVVPPAGLQQYLGLELTPTLPAQGYPTFVLERIDETAKDYEAEADLYLVLELREDEEPALRLQGRLLREKEAIDLQVPLPPAEDREAWSCLALLRRAGRWDGRLHAVPVDYDELSTEARKSFQMDLPLQVLTPEGSRDLVPSLAEPLSPEDLQSLYPDRRPFLDTKICGVPVAPRDEACAQRWFRALLEESIEDYESRSAYQARARALLERFRGYRSKLAVPTQAELAQQLRTDDRQPAVYWRLQAPLDLPFDQEGR